MNWIRLLIKTTILYFLCMNLASAKVMQQNFIIPFENFTLNPNVLITATFNFGPFSVIFCFDNTTTQNIGRITWPFKGNIYQSTLPIFLTTNPIFSGQFIDRVGKLSIQNTTGGPLVISCLFAY